MTLIATSLALLAIAAGLFLLDKTRKESLGNLFKFSSWLIIVVGFLCLACISVRGFMHCGKGGCNIEKRCERMQEGCVEKQMNCHKTGMEDCGKHGMMQECCHMDKHEEKCCASREKSCTKTTGEEVEEKDSVVIEK